MQRSVYYYTNKLEAVGSDKELLGIDSIRSVHIITNYAPTFNVSTMVIFVILIYGAKTHVSIAFHPILALLHIPHLSFDPCAVVVVDGLYLTCVG